MNFEKMPSGGESVFPKERSENRACEMYVQEIKRLGNEQQTSDYIELIVSEDCREYTGADEFLKANPGYEEELNGALSEDEKEALKEYSGYNYKRINSVARGFWDYDQLGERTEEAEQRSRQAVEMINGAIDKAPDVNEDFIAYRGTNLDSFHGYGVSSLEDLKKLEGQFHLERGFMSTSVAEEGSYAGRDFDDPLRKECNISMRYRVPAGTHEGVLLTGDLSYSGGQSEFLIRSGSLSYIEGVKLSEDGGSAVIECVLIPRQLYTA